MYGISTAHAHYPLLQRAAIISSMWIKLLLLWDLFNHDIKKPNRCEYIPTMPIQRAAIMSVSCKW